jgi:type I restriction enzyme S subunit
MTRRYPAYRASGVEWLGEVPEGWEIKKLKHLGEAIIGLTYSPNDVVDEGDGILVLRSSNVQQGAISLHDNVYVNAKIPEQLVTRKGDILICSRNGSRALIGKNATIAADAAGLTAGESRLESDLI